MAGAVVHVAAEQGPADAGLHLVGDEPAQRTGAVHRVEALLGDVPAGVLADLERHPPIRQPGPQVVEHQLDDALDLRLGQRLEQHDVVDAVQELRAEVDGAARRGRARAPPA